MSLPPDSALARLATERNIWMATVRPHNNEPSVRPHLVPVWFAWHDGKIYVCIKAASVKGRNLTHNHFVSLALEDGSKVVICEGEAAVVAEPWPSAVCAIFYEKYNWHIPDGDYDMLVAVTPNKWLVW